MKKIILIIILIAITAMFISTCCDKSTSPSNDTHYIGWTVGDPEGGYGSIFKTTNSGQIWMRQGDTLTVPNVSLNAVRAVDSLTAWIAGDADDGWATILKTTDGGLNWQRIGSRGVLDNVELLGLHVVDDNTIWVVGSDGAVIVTDDGGSSWVSKADTSFSYYDITSIEIFDQHIWACGNGTGNQGGVIIHSLDGGDSWQKLAQGSFLGARGMIDISAPSDSCVWVVGHGRTILKTNDSGISWEIQHAEVSPTWDANGVTAISNNEAWVVEDLGNIYHTDDGGEIWDIQSSVPETVHSYFLYRISPINSQIVWVVGPCATPPFDGIILYTADGGSTWVKQDHQPDVPLCDVSFVGSYH